MSGCECWDINCAEHCNHVGTDRIRKYDGGKRPLLCARCYAIVGRWTDDESSALLDALDGAHRDLAQASAERTRLRNALALVEMERDNEKRETARLMTERDAARAEIRAQRDAMRDAQQAIAERTAERDGLSRRFATLQHNFDHLARILADSISASNDRAPQCPEWHYTVGEPQRRCRRSVGHDGPCNFAGADNRDQCTWHKGPWCCQLRTGHAGRCVFPTDLRGDQ